MQGFSVLKVVFDAVLKTGLTNRVFHSVVKFTNAEGSSYPMYPSGGDEYTYVGIDDTKALTVYCRQIDDLRTVKTEGIGGCSSPIYKVAVPHRLVIFSDFEKRNHDDLLAKLMQAVFMPKVKMLRVISDKEKLVNMESTAKGFNFGDETFYRGIDFEIYFDLTPTNCALEISCTQILNPYTKN